MSSIPVLAASVAMALCAWYLGRRSSGHRKPKVTLELERLTSVSHEMRTPLNGILGASQLLLQAKPTSEQREYLEMIRGSGAMLLTLLNDILDYSRIHGGKLRLDSAPFHLRRWVHQCVKTLAPEAHAKGLELAYWVAPEVHGVVEGDAVRLQQVLVNLLVNAIKYTSQGHVLVEVHALEARTGLRLSVRDTGIGIPRSCQRSIFEAFVQATEPSSGAKSGLGLGLTISSEIIERMDGDIRVESELDAGSAFHVEVPLIHSTDVDEEERSAISYEGVRALVVDDSAVTRGLLARQLRIWGVEVTTAGDAEAARSAVSSGQRYHFVLLDSKLPGVDACVLAEEIQCRSRIPGILMTSTNDHVEPETLRAGNFVGQLSKPVAPSQLLRAIEIIRRGSTTRRIEDVRVQVEAPVPLRGQRVLVAEDDPVCRALMVRMLEKNGAEVVAAENGLEALRLGSEEEFDVAVLDIEMPDLDGLSVAREIRRRERRSGRRRFALVASTAHARPEDGNRCLAAGMDSVLVKPLDDRELVSAILALRNREGGREVFHRDAALRRANGDVSLLSELANVFLEDVPKHLGTVSLEIDARQFSSIERLCHRLKGALLTLAAERAAGEALELETSAQAEDSERCRASLERLRVELQRLEAELHVQFGVRPKTDYCVPQREDR